MPKRTIASVSGDLGELKVISDFVSMGAAVNSLSHSDFGWDAHVHTPEDVLDRAKLPATWKMSGLSAHVQVKNSQSGSAAAVRVGSLRAWLAGSRVGTPTFYFFVDQGTTPMYASPRMLGRILQANADDDDTEEVSIGRKQTRLADYDGAFAHLLRLWTRYPRVLLHEYIQVDDWHQMAAADLAEEHENFVGHVFLAWLRSHFPETPVPPKGLYGLLGNQIIWAAADALSGLDGGGAIPDRNNATALRLDLEARVVDRLVKYSQVSETASEERKKLGALWPEASLMTSYALATSPEAACEEAKQLVRDVMAYYKLCLGWAEARTGTPDVAETAKEECTPEVVEEASGQ